MKMDDFKKLVSAYEDHCGVKPGFFDGITLEQMKSSAAFSGFGDYVAGWTAAMAAVAIPAPEGAQLPPLPEPHWPRGYQGAVPSGGYTADQMHAYARAALAAPAPQADEVLIAIKRGEDYQDVHPELVAADALGNTPFEWRVIDAAPQTKEPTNDR